MNCKRILPSFLLALSFLCMSCGLQEVPNGERCEENTAGRYAYDIFSTFKTDTNGTSQIIVNTGNCVESFPYCIDGVLCSFCPKRSFYVTKEDQSTEFTCMTCEEMESCTSESCTIAKVNCDPKECKQTCKDDILMSCNYGTRNLEACQKGCTLDNTQCAVERECRKGEVDLDNKCVCDVQNHWTGPAGKCVCSADEHRIEKDDKCVCNGEQHWIDVDGKCVCDEGLIEKYGGCIPVDECHPAREVFDEASKSCICNADGNWSGEPDHCDCKDGFVLFESGCIEKKVCKSEREIYDYKLEKCICNEADNWIGESGSCQCKPSFEQKDEKCVFSSHCKWNETFDDVLNKCVCDTDNNWVETTNGCSCKDNYILQNGQCVLDESCDANKVFHPELKKCVCDETGFWVEKDGNCTCKDGYVAINGKCVIKKNCDLDKETYNETTNVCSCNKSLHWTGNAGNCSCAFGYKLDGNQCRYYNKGELFKYGNYYINNKQKKESIQWRVLNVDKTNQKYLLITENGIDVHEYHNILSTDIKVTWKISDVRRWLNEDFLAAAFDDKQQEKILSTDVKTPANICFGTSGGADTKDRLFLLSFGELSTYFPKQSDRVLCPTPYAESRGAVGEKEDKTGVCGSRFPGWWILRSPGFTPQLITFVYSTGRICGDSKQGTCDCNGESVSPYGRRPVPPMIRPAMWLSIK